MTAATLTDPGDTPVLPLDGVDRAVEVDVLLAREVVEHRHARHPVGCQKSGLGR